MVGLKKRAHTQKSHPKSGEPQRYSWGTQKNKIKQTKKINHSETTEGRQQRRKWTGQGEPWVKGPTSQVAGSPAVCDRTVIVLDQTVIVLDRTIIVLDRSVKAIYGIFSLNFLRLGGGSDRLWLLRAARHTSAPALPTLSILSGDRYVNKTLPRAGLFPGARSCAFKPLRCEGPQVDHFNRPGSTTGGQCYEQRGR